MAIYLDTETCGLHGPACLIQWAKDDGEVNLWSPWEESIGDTIRLIEMIVDDELIGFNIAFDWFHLCKMYTTLIIMDDFSATLGDCVTEYALKEEQARLGPCLKPKSALDLMIHARRGPYQSTMGRDDIRIKRVPTALAHDLAAILEEQVQLKDIYFAKKKKSGPRWSVDDIVEDDGTVNRHFKNIVLRFHPTTALKALAIDALGLDPSETLIYDRISLPKKLFPKEYGYAPFATALGQPGSWNGAWPEVIRFHIDHWTFNSLAREYAKLDVVYLQKLRAHFGNPPCGDNDSILSCLVAAVRWRGYAIDEAKIKKLRAEAVESKSKAPRAPKRVRWWLEQVMSDAEKAGLGGSTKKTILEDMAKNMLADCPDCKGTGCVTCEGKGKVKHEAAKRARLVLDARSADKRIDVLDKLLRAGRFHASFKVTGTKSNRMSGDSGFNPQGIDHKEDFRECFPLADNGLELSAGDFSSFEVVLADAVYNDPVLRNDLQTGRSVHTVMATQLFPDKTFEEIEASKGSKIFDYRDIGKRAVFALFYGGNANTIKMKLNIDLEIAEKAVEKFLQRYKRVGIVQQVTRDKFCSMRQPNGIGTRVVWHEPSDYVAAKSGFCRYFTLENMICKILYTLANNPPDKWKEKKIKVLRRVDGREQFACGATQSALYACAFAIQAANMRAAVNHEIQCWGAELTKELQCDLWEMQPTGIHPWEIVPMNVHDEILAPLNPKRKDEAKQIVDTFLDRQRANVPLIAIEWHKQIDSWADK